MASSLRALSLAASARFRQTIQRTPGGGLHRDFLDLQMAVLGGVVSGEGQGFDGVGGDVAHPLPGDPLPAASVQVVQVRVRGEAALGDRDHPAEVLAAHPVAELGEAAHQQRLATHRATRITTQKTDPQMVRNQSTKPSH